MRSSILDVRRKTRRSQGIAKRCDLFPNLITSLDTVPVTDTFQDFELLLARAEMIVNVLASFQWRGLVLFASEYQRGAFDRFEAT